MTARTGTPRMRVGRCACRFRYTTRLFDRHYQDHELLEPCGYHATQSREIAGLRERLERAEKDAERYRYCVVSGAIDGQVCSYCYDKELDEPADLCHTEEYKALADKAIDAALAGGE